MRQDAARRDDGNDPLQRAVDLHLWRQRATRPVRRKNPHCAGFLRGRGRLYDRRNRACLPANDWRLRRTVHRQHDGNGFRGDGVDDAQRVDDPRRLCRARASRPPGRAACGADVATGRAVAAPNRDAKIAGEWRGHCRRHRRLDQRRAAFAGACQRSRHILYVRRCRRRVCANALDRQSAPGREIYRQRRLRHRRHSRCDPRAGRKRPHRRHLPDDYRQDDCGRI